MKKILTFSIVCLTLFFACKKETTKITIESNVTDVSAFGESDGAIDIHVNGGQSPYSYKWSCGETSEDISNKAAGTYTVTVTDTDGKSEQAEFSLQSPDVITVEVKTTEPSTANNDGSIDITVSGGVPPYSYRWSNNATSEDISNLSADLYIVTITDANGAEKIDSVQLIAPLHLELIVKDESFEGSKDGKITAEITGGTEPYTVTWSNGATSNNNYKLVAGEYTCNIVDAKGNSLSKSASIVQLVSFDIPESLNYITAYDQSSLRIDDNGTIIYFDPAYVSGTGEDADIVFTSHNHGDHMGRKEFGTENTKYVSPENVKSNYTNCQDANFYLAVEDTTFTIGNISIDVVPAYNEWHPRGTAMGVGFVVTLSDGTIIYFMGDTELIPEMSNIDCDIAFVPLGPTYTMASVEDAATAVENCKAEIAIPIHGANEGKDSGIAEFYTILAPKNIQVIHLPRE